MITLLNFLIFFTNVVPELNVLQYRDQAANNDYVVDCSLKVIGNYESHLSVVVMKSKTVNKHFLLKISRRQKLKKEILKLSI